MIFAIVVFCSALTSARQCRSDLWQHTNYIWNFGLIALCDKGVPCYPIKLFAEEASFEPDLYEDIKKGDIVFIQFKNIPRFYREILQKTKHPFIVLISHGDESFPRDCPNDFDMNDFIEHPLVYHIFTQNYDYQGQSDKISPIPIGIDFHSIGYRNTEGYWGEMGTPLQQEEMLNSLLNSFSPTLDRKKRIFVDFQHHDTMRIGYNRHLQFGEDRTSIFNCIKKTGLVDYSSYMKRSELWAKKGEYAFSVSPHGNGLDCHRTWEDLTLGCIVIVKTSPLNFLYEGLPVVIVDDWSEINAENLDNWLKIYGDAFENPLYREKVTTQYWFNKIKKKQKKLLKS